MEVMNFYASLFAVFVFCLNDKIGLDFRILRDHIGLPDVKKGSVDHLEYRSDDIIWYTMWVVMMCNYLMALVSDLGLGQFDSKVLAGARLIIQYLLILKIFYSKGDLSINRPMVILYAVTFIINIYMTLITIPVVFAFDVGNPWSHYIVTDIILNYLLPLYVLVDWLQWRGDILIWVKEIIMDVKYKDYMANSDFADIYDGETKLRDFIDDFVDDAWPDPDNLNDLQDAELTNDQLQKRFRINKKKNQVLNDELGDLEIENEKIKAEMLEVVNKCFKKTLFDGLNYKEIVDVGLRMEFVLERDDPQCRD